MRAIDLITEEIPPLIHTDTGEKAINWMDEFKVSHVPVLKNGTFVGVVSESDILDHLDLNSPLDGLFAHLPRPYVLGNRHIYDVLAKMSDDKLSVLPILDEKENYLGCTSVYELMTQLAKTGSIKEPGAILVLEINSVDYSMAQIAQIVEGNNARILSSYIISDSNSTKLDITLKINQLDVSNIIRTFERYDYLIKDSYQTGISDYDIQNRFDALMNYWRFCNFDF
jgi:CBS domain-containing protein